ncbi:hypothetical protein SAMN04487939_11080 [Lysobacter sp. yr284]|uniref:hypothetical protein n=1 Tax=Lysobacter sp. yr284 TaxID=1761791 RepID=UPI00089A80DD|nr:hypothetical protein [Lysobacter sp. yr284]SDY96504.1 hypothetical protein SAMN04487939_11080 [Lysobacter sp. yr284]
MRFVIAVLALTLVSTAQSTYAQEPETEVVDGLIKRIYATLARDRGFNVLSAPDAGAAQIGNVYYVTDPACASDLLSMAKTGTPTQLFLALELPHQERFKPQPISNWTSVRLVAIAGRAFKTDVGAEKPEWAAQIGLSIAAMEQTNAQILFATRRFSSIPIKKAMVNELLAQGVDDASDLGDGATGALAPHEELIVQKFEFDRKAVRGKKGGVMVRLMELFSARVEAGSEVTRTAGFKQATYSTAAFKSVTTLFRNCSVLATPAVTAP